VFLYGISSQAKLAGTQFSITCREPKNNWYILWLSAGMLFDIGVIFRQGENPIPANARITYEIDLLAVRDGPDMETMSDQERIKIG